MTIFRIVAVGLIGLMGLSFEDMVSQENQNSNTRDEKDALEQSGAKTEDVLLENLDVDQFQEQHGMLVATNHVN